MEKPVVAPILTPVKSKQKKLIEELLKAYSRCECVRLVNRGNAAIFCALAMVRSANKPGSERNTILIPDQGGWISFETYPPLLGFDVVKVKTDRGIIDLADLKNKSSSAAAFIVTSFAGYFAEQQIRDISAVCHGAGCLLIEDASGAIGDAVLCDGGYSDIIVASFGEHKPVDNGYGGFVAANDKGLFASASVAFSLTNFFEDYSVLLEKLKEVPARLDFFFAKQEQVKRDMKRLGVEVLHPRSRGLNVIVKPKDDEEKRKVSDYCEEQGLETVACPKYIRVEEPAISIEIKRL
jgi:hypothetical protein